MSAREWQPGDVAVITVPRRTAPGEAVTATGNAEVRALHDRGGWIALADPDYFWGAGYAFHAAPPRPLVVIDPAAAPFADSNSIGALVANLREGGTIMRDWIADQIEAQTAPPKPAEPAGLGAVVEDASGKPFVRISSGFVKYPWRDEEDSAYRWHEIDAARVVAEGVTQ